MSILRSNRTRPAILSAALLLSPVALVAMTAPPAPPTPAGAEATKMELPDAKALIKKAHDAAGGMDAFKEVKTVKYDITMATPQGEQKMVAYTLRPNFIAFDQPTPTGNTVRVFSNGKYVWVGSPQDTGMQVMPASQLGPIQPVLNVQNVFLELTERYKDHTTVEQTEHGGEMAYRVEAVDKLDDQKISFFFAKEGGEFLGQRVAFTTPMGPMNAATTVTEWEELDGRKFIRKLEMVLGPQVVTFMFGKIEVNGPEESMFDMPEMVKEQIKAIEEQEKAEEEGGNHDDDGDNHGGGEHEGSGHDNDGDGGR